jgi:hypothetical protein
MKISKIIILLIYFLFLISVVHAQQPDSLVVKHKKGIHSEADDSIELRNEKSVVDILHDIFPRANLFRPDTSNKEEGKFYFSALPVMGYTLQTSFAALISFNAAVYTDNPDSVNLSNASFNPTVSVYKQLILPVQSNIWTKKNKYNLVGNWTFFKFPQNTYGLGGHTSYSNPDPIDYNLLMFRETVLRSIVPNLFLGIGYNLDYHWNITETGTGDGIPTDFDKYGFKSRTVSSGITYNFLYDTRRNPINPPRGSYVNLILRTNYTFLGSDANWNSLRIDLRKYFKLPESSRNVLAFWSYSWLTLSGKPPYLDLPSTGWDNFFNQGRGYIQSRFRGNDLLAFEGEYRYAITRNGLLGGVIFFTSQSVTDWPDNKFTTIWPGGGIGIRIKLNKYSNTNVCVDYAVGLGGSRGFYVNLGEVF